VFDKFKPAYFAQQVGQGGAIGKFGSTDGKCHGLNFTLNRLMKPKANLLIGWLLAKVL
jgi:hypothetical protein